MGGLWFNYKWLVRVRPVQANLCFPVQGTTEAKEFPGIRDGLNRKVRHEVRLVVIDLYLILVMDRQHKLIVNAWNETPFLKTRIQNDECLLHY